MTVDRSTFSLGNQPKWTKRRGWGWNAVGPSARKRPRRIGRHRSGDKHRLLLLTKKRANNTIRCSRFLCLRWLRNALVGAYLAKERLNLRQVCRCKCFTCLNVQLKEQTVISYKERFDVFIRPAKKKQRVIFIEKKRKRRRASQRERKVAFFSFGRLYWSCLVAVFIVLESWLIFTGWNTPAASHSPYLPVQIDGNNFGQVCHLAACGSCLYLVFVNVSATWRKICQIKIH